MPRPSVARKSNSNRHEHGGTGSGKKLSKQKSNSHLSGSSAASPSNSGPSLQVDPSASRSSSAPTLALQAKDNGSTIAKSDDNDRTYINGNVKGNADMSYGPVVSTLSQSDVSGQPTRRAGRSKSHQNASVNPFQLASTILKSCPMYDTIAILIFLLQLPPMVLTLVQFLFASLTFLPPGGTSAGSLTSNFDIFQGPAGTPSLGTMIAMDGFCLLFWGLFMWTWTQNFALDLAHVQVAITLGGGGSGKNGGVNALCVAIVLALHLIRSKGVQDFVFSHLTSAKIVSPDLLSEYSYLIPAELRRTQPQSSPSWIRSLLAVHILAQAGTAMARRSMAKNRSPTPSRSGKRVDTEASAGSQAQIDFAFDPASGTPSFLCADSQLSAPAVAKDSRDRLVSAKKRRRQAAQIRNRQPFWAALSNIKITVMREYEQSRALSKSGWDVLMSEDDLQGASLENGLVWITGVDSSSIRFAASEFVPADDSHVSGTCDAARLRDEEMDPLYVCVNGALWATATLYRVSDVSKGSNAVQWRGEISGLAPNCAYTCSFVRRDTEEEICVMSVKTPVTSDAEQVTAPSVSAPPRPSYRPSSPTTTLRNSIVNAEAKLNEKRARLKKTRNDHKVVTSRIRRELDSFNNRLHSGTDEDKQKQRSLQLERNIRQTEETTAALEAQLGSLENIPDEELGEWTTQKANFERELELFNSAKEELVSARSIAAQETSALESELQSAAQRRERLQSRRARVNEQFERIVSANAQGLNERERRAAEQFAREQEHAKLEAGFNEQFISISQSIQDYQLRTNHVRQQATAAEQAIQRQQQQMLIDHEPLTPEGNLPGTNPFLGNSNLALPSLSGSMTNNRPLTGLNFPVLKSSPLQKSPSPVGPTSSHSTSPAYLPPYSQNLPVSPLANSSSYFASEFPYRGRSLSNQSGRSSQPGSDPAEANRFVSRIDTLDATGDKRRSSGSEMNLAWNPRLGPIGSPFQHAGSRGSGSGSGSGSPSSARAKEARGE